MRILNRIVIVVLGLAVIAIAAGAIYQSVASARDAARYPMAGECIDIGGRSLHLYAT